MKLRFHVPAILAAGEKVLLLDDELHHARVTRVRLGEAVEVFDGRGSCFVGELTEIDTSRAVVRLIEPVAQERESPLAITLAMAVIQLDNFELVLQKATELGVRSVIPLLTERLEVRQERFRGKADRWKKIVFEAVKQSGRSLIPAIELPQSFADVMSRDGVKIVFDADETPSHRPVDHPEAITIFIGPEGGWSEEELALAKERGALIQRLGPRRLRAETAAIVGMARVARDYGDL
jgi:16S rRNA (uracil1498-N3)-methyltransferase